MSINDVDDLARDVELQIPAQRLADTYLVTLPWWVAILFVQLLGNMMGFPLLAMSDAIISLLAILLGIPLAIGLRRANVASNLLIIGMIIALWGFFSFFLWQYWDTWAAFFLVLSPDGWLALAVVGLFWTVIMAWASYTFWESFLAALRQRGGVLSNAPLRISLRSWHAFFSMPRHIRVFPLWRRLLIFLASGLSAAYLGMFLAFLFEGYDNPRELLQQSLGGICSDLGPIERLECGNKVVERFDTQLVQSGFLQLVIVLTGMHLPAYLARRLSRTSFITVLEQADQKAILYLRPFSTDEHRLASGFRTLAARVFNIGQSLARTLESVIVEELQYRGPVVAIGDPGRRELHRGALREYFADDSWQDAVEEQIKAAQLIVLVFEDRDAIWWELAKIFETDAVDQTIILFSEPPSLDLLSKIAGTLCVNLELQEAIAHNLLGWRPIREGLFTTSKIRSYLTYSATLRTLART